MCPQRRTLWTREQIRSARRVDLVPLLTQRGLTLHERSPGNYEVCEHPGPIIKNWYWRWPAKDISGNTIDFFENVLGIAFSDAMKAILNGDDTHPVTLRRLSAKSLLDEVGQKRGNSDRNLDTSSANCPKSAQL